MKSFILFPAEPSIWDEYEYPVRNLLAKWEALYNHTRLYQPLPQEQTVSV